MPPAQRPGPRNYLNLEAQLCPPWGTHHSTLNTFSTRQACNSLVWKDFSNSQPRKTRALQMSCKDQADGRPLACSSHRQSPGRIHSYTEDLEHLWKFLKQILGITLQYKNQAIASNLQSLGLCRDLEEKWISNLKKTCRISGLEHVEPQEQTGFNHPWIGLSIR